MANVLTNEADVNFNNVKTKHMLPPKITTNQIIFFPMKQILFSNKAKQILSDEANYILANAADIIFTQRNQYQFSFTLRVAVIL